MTAELRFAFGANWARFLATIDETRISAAEESLRTMLGVADLRGKRFLDIGSGSGLFSLAARRLGAEVYSFDYDPESVACTAELRRRYRPDDTGWTVERGSALDADYVRSLGAFDVVYSWGVLHHTGKMWQALDLAAQPLAPGGRLFIAIYHDQGSISRYWLAVKRRFNSGNTGRWSMIVLHAPYLLGLRWLVRLVRRRGRIERGMTYWYDMLDWLGGLPFEVASPDALHRFFGDRQFVLLNQRLVGRRHGCNEFVFQRALALPAP